MMMVMNFLFFCICLPCCVKVAIDINTLGPKSSIRLQMSSLSKEILIITAIALEVCI